MMPRPGPINLGKVMAHSDSSDLADVLKKELESLDGLSLPLQQCLTRSSYTDGSNFDVTILSVQLGTDGLRARAGILYQGIIAGCSCADDPTPQSTIDEYCELEFLIEGNGNTTVTVLHDES